MRTIPAGAVAAVAAGLATPAVATAVNPSQRLTVELERNRAGTPSSPRSVGSLSLDIETRPRRSDRDAYVTRRTTISFDRNLVFGTRSFPTCAPADAARGAPACEAAKVGSGSAVGGSLALGLRQDLDVTAFNGPVQPLAGRSGPTLLLRVKTADPAAGPQVDELIVGLLQRASGPYGRKLVVDLPPSLRTVSGAPVSLRTFKVRVGGVRRGVPYVGLRGCPHSHRLRIRADFDYTDGTANGTGARPAPACRR